VRVVLGLDMGPPLSEVREARGQRTLQGRLAFLGLSGSGVVTIHAAGGRDICLYAWGRIGSSGPMHTCCLYRRHPGLCECSCGAREMKATDERGAE
jgi:hypothetical protein